MVKRWNSGKRVGSSRDRLATVVLSFLLMVGVSIPMAQLNYLPVYAATVGSWQGVKDAIAADETEITLSGDFAYDGKSVVISDGKNITINGTGTIYSAQLDDKYEPMFKVESGGTLTIDNEVTLSGKIGSNGSQCPDGTSSTPTYTADKFTGEEGATTYTPKGFFIDVEKGGTATLNGTISDFVTSRNKATTPRYVAPVVANGEGATFNLGAKSVIKNNVVGYIVDEDKAYTNAHVR